MNFRKIEIINIFFIILSFIAIGSLIFSASAIAQNLLTTVGKGKWMVIRQPGEDSFCYIKQKNKLMDLSMQNTNRGSEGIDTRLPYITYSFWRGLEEKIVYWVDNGPIRTINVEDLTTDISFNLSKSVIPELKHGMILTVRVRPKGKKPQEQKFDLRGFTKALSWLDKQCCNSKDAEFLNKSVTFSKPTRKINDPIELLKSANFSNKCGIDTTSLIKNIEWFSSAAAISIVRWSASNKGDNKYQVVLDYIDGSAGPKKAIWTVDMQAKDADYVNKPAELFSCLGQ